MNSFEGYETSLRVRVLTTLCVCMQVCQVQMQQYSVWGLSISCSDYVGGGPLTAANQTVPDMKMSFWKCTVNGMCTPFHLFVNAKTYLVLFFMSVGAEQISIEDCCKDGQKRANDNEDCASLPLVSESTTCR